MYCVNCGNSLRDGVKFCGTCGTKVESSMTSLEPKLVQLAELPGDLPRCKVSIREITAEEPDDDGDIGLKIQYVVDNDSEEDWEHIATRTIVLDGSGRVIDETYDTIEQTMPAGEEIEMEAWIGGINAALLYGNSNNTQVIVHAVASRLVREKLGVFTVPADPFSVVPIQCTTIDNTVKVISGSLWRTPPDSDKDCRVVLKVLCQNLTETWLPVVKLEAKLIDKMDRDINSLDHSEEVRPGSITTIDCSTYLKQNKLANGVTTNVALNIFTPIASGFTQQSETLATLTARSPNSRPFEVAHQQIHSSEISTSDSQWNGCWEERDGRTICRWILVWQELGNLTIGALGGYSGGGTFQLETFAINGDTITCSNEASLSESFDSEIVNKAESCLDRALEFHENDAWLDSDTLLLKSKISLNLDKRNDLLLGGSPVPNKLISIFSNLGLISQPNIHDTQTALFTFTRTIGFELDETELEEFISGLRLNSEEELQDLANQASNGVRDENSEKAYLLIDKRILPSVQFNVFFDNFNNPNSIFLRPEDSTCTIENPSKEFRQAKIVYMAIWDSGREDKSKRVEITIEAKYLFEIQSDINVEDPFGIEDEELQDQLRECQNMFNFSIENFYYDDDESFEHEWRAEFV